jgi:hypothetical protein
MKPVPSRAKDLTGKTFGELTVLGFHGYYKLPCGKSKLQWLCRCSCGIVKPILSTTLRNTKVQSCGHYKAQIASKTFRKPLREVVQNNTMHHYKKNAKRMGRVFDLTIDQWFEMITSNCHYCGSLPSNSWGHRYSDEVFRYNGVDRVDNEQGYTPDNTVSCCAPCNMMKRGMAVNDFLAHVKRIFDFNSGLKP